MKNVFIIVLALIVTFPAFAQDGVMGYDQFYQVLSKSDGSKTNGGEAMLTEQQIISAKGSPYESETFLLGSIWTDNTVQVENVKLRYNMSSDQIEIKSKDNPNEYGAVTKAPGITVKILGVPYIFLQNVPNLDNRYYKLLVDGTTYSLYKQLKVEYTPPAVAQKGYASNSPGEFKQLETYYLAEGDNSFVEINTRKSKLLDLLDDKENEIKEFMKNNRLNPKNEDELIAVIKQYDALNQ